MRKNIDALKKQLAAMPTCNSTHAAQAVVEDDNQDSFHNLTRELLQ